MGRSIDSQRASELVHEEARMLSEADVLVSHRLEHGIHVLSPQRRLVYLDDHIDRIRKKGTLRKGIRIKRKPVEPGLWKKRKRPGSYLLSRGLRSTIGARGLDFRVRDGNGYGPSAMVTGPIDYL